MEEKVMQPAFLTLFWMIIIGLLPQTTSAQCPFTNTVFGDGEKIRYTVSYNWGPVWVDAGQVVFTVKSEMFRGKQVFHLQGSGKSFPSYDLLFKVRDYFDSWIDPATFQTLDFKRYVYEGKYALLNTLTFNYEKNIVVANTKRNNNPVRTDTLPLRACAFDMLSAIYYIRTLDLTDVTPGAKRYITVLIDDAYFDIYFRPMGKEVVESTDGKKYRCVKFAAKMVQGTIFKGEEDVLVWVTDDANKVPIYIEAKIIVGTIKAYLKDAEGLRNPVGAVVR